MNAFVTEAGGFLLTYCLHSTLALIVALGAAALLRDRALAVQELLLRIAVLGPIVSSALQWFLFGGAHFAVGTVVSMVEVHEPAGAAGASPAAAPAVMAGAGAIDWGTLLVAGASASALLGLLHFVRTRQRLRGLLAVRRVETSPRILAIAARVAECMGLRHTQHVSCCEGLPSPLAFGMAAPEICLPERAIELEDGELGAMLAHEMAHLLRRDPLWLQVTAVAAALFPWQLLHLPARRRLLHLAELRCDAMAGRTAGSLAVARCLLQVAAWVECRREPLPAVALAMAARPSALRVRVEAAIADRRDLQLPAGAAAVLTGALVALLCAAAPGAGAHDLVPAAEGRPAAGAFALMPLELREQRELLDVERRQLEQRRLQAPADPALHELFDRLDARWQALLEAERRLQLTADAAASPEPQPARKS